MKFARVPNSGGLFIKGDIMPEEGSFPFVVECKNQKLVKLLEWNAQLKAEMTAMRKLGILVFHRHGTDEDYAFMPKFPYDIAEEPILFEKGQRFVNLETKKIFSTQGGYISTLEKILLAIKFYADRGETYDYEKICASKVH